LTERRREERRGSKKYDKFPSSSSSTLKRFNKIKWTVPSTAFYLFYSMLALAWLVGRSETRGTGEMMIIIRMKFIVGFSMSAEQKMRERDYEKLSRSQTKNKGIVGVDAAARSKIED
jgi:hypothetical protein